MSYYNIIYENVTNNCIPINCNLCIIQNKSYCLNYKDIIDKTTEILYEIPSIISDNIVMVGDIEIIRRDLKENKENLVDFLPQLINSIDIGKNYIFSGEEYTLTIKPTNITIENSTYVDFLACENILRNHYNIDESRILTFLQLELDNKKDKSLINQVGYQVYDNKKIF